MQSAGPSSILFFCMCNCLSRRKREEMSIFSEQFEEKAHNFFFFSLTHFKLKEKKWAKVSQVSTFELNCKKMKNCFTQNQFPFSARQQASNISDINSDIKDESLDLRKHTHTHTPIVVLLPVQTRSFPLHPLKIIPLGIGAPAISLQLIATACLSLSFLSSLLVGQSVSAKHHHLTN